MRKFVLPVLAASIIMSSNAEASAREGPAIPEGFETYVADNMRRWSIPGVAVAVIREGEAVYTKGFGVREPRGLGRSDSPPTRFRT